MNLIILFMKEKVLLKFCEKNLFSLPIFLFTGAKAPTTTENFKKENEVVGKEAAGDLEVPSVKIVSSGILKKGFDIGESLKPPSNSNSPRCRSPAGGRTTPTEAENASKTTGR